MPYKCGHNIYQNNSKISYIMENKLTILKTNNKVLWINRKIIQTYGDNHLLTFTSPHINCAVSHFTGTLTRSIGTVAQIDR